MAIEKKLDHVVSALRKVLSKESDHPKLRAWVGTYVKLVQELEDTAWLVIESRTLDGEGAQLDAVGRLVGRYRGDLSDDDYKVALRAQLRVLRSKGKPLDLEEVTTLSLPAGFTYLYDEDYPKSATIEVVGAVDFDASVLWFNIRRTKPAGTRLFQVWHASEEADMLKLTYDDEGSGGSGLSYDDEEADGLNLAHVIGS